jgi:hypothetical protein
MKETWEWDGVNMHDKIPVVWRTIMYLLAIILSALLLMGITELWALWQFIEP